MLFPIFEKKQETSDVVSLHQLEHEFVWINLNMNTFGVESRSTSFRSSNCIFSLKASLVTQRKCSIVEFLFARTLMRYYRQFVTCGIDSSSKILLVRKKILN